MAPRFHRRFCTTIPSGAHLRLTWADFHTVCQTRVRNLKREKKLSELEESFLEESFPLGCFWTILKWPFRENGQTRIGNPGELKSKEGERKENDTCLVSSHWTWEKRLKAFSWLYFFFNFTKIVNQTLKNRQTLPTTLIFSRHFKPIPLSRNGTNNDSNK